MPYPFQTDDLIEPTIFICVNGEKSTISSYKLDMVHQQITLTNTIHLESLEFLYLAVDYDFRTIIAITEVKKPKYIADEVEVVFFDIYDRIFWKATNGFTYSSKVTSFSYNQQLKKMIFISNNT